MRWLYVDANVHLAFYRENAGAVSKADASTNGDTTALTENIILEIS
jgi:hypothetical protein